MKRMFSFGLLVGVVLSAASAMGSAEQKGCSLQGSWLGIRGAVLLANYDGQSASFGTANVEMPTFDPTLRGMFPDAVKVTGSRGMWERTGGNTFAYTEVGYVLDTEGNLVWIGKNSGNKTLTEDCNLMTVVSTLEVFAPVVNPFEGAPLISVPVRTMYLQRMRVDPPASFDE